MAVPPASDQGKRIEVHITDSDRVVRFTLGEEQSVDAEVEVVDAVLSAVTADDPGEVERRLESGLTDYGTVHRGP